MIGQVNVSFRSWIFPNDFRNYTHSNVKWASSRVINLTLLVSIRSMMPLWLSFPKRNYGSIITTAGLDACSELETTSVGWRITWYSFLSNDALRNTDCIPISSSVCLWPSPSARVGKTISPIWFLFNIMAGIWKQVDFPDPVACITIQSFFKWYAHNASIWNCFSWLLFFMHREANPCHIISWLLRLSSVTYGINTKKIVS